MSAKTGAGPHPWRFQAWCDECKDGLNSRSHADADDWASTHNHRRHQNRSKEQE